MRYYCAYLLRVVRTSSLRCSTIFALLACFAPCLLRFPFLSIPSVPHNFRACFSFSIITAYLSLSLSFVTTGSVTWAAWISASAFCPSCVPRRKRRRNEGKNRIQICRRSRRRYAKQKKKKKKKKNDDDYYEYDENKNNKNNNNNRVTSSSTRRRKRFSQACSRV